ncbi:aminoglycoside 3'-phosphotransferase [Rhodococcoides yunnanense]|uniref:aminoglycoside 3'-phosphotransferase n=1 Tax=Rhodococcoides yunnanense TaxID=278209 RepID=UPI00157C4EC8|nr:aminoglycoside 3'-phosphotransferase [Rhodococcus yunnanensis]
MPVPEVVRSFAEAGEPVEPVWRNGAGGVTYRLGSRFVKWQPHHPEISLEREATKLRWVNSYTPSPQVLGLGRTNGASWLMTHAVPGSSAVSSRWLADPRAAVHAVGHGLRELHERLPVDQCPWRWDPETRADNAVRRGIHVGSTLRDTPEIDRLVVCHGDACCPNTILADDGQVSGHVDFGSLGVADRWADIAVAAMSTRWNYGPGWEHELVAAYGLAVDDVRMSYYQALWNAT